MVDTRGNSQRKYSRYWNISIGEVEYTIDISLYTDRVPFELLDSAALLLRESCGGGG
jgi:hypothetical protein